MMSPSNTPPVQQSVVAKIAQLSSLHTTELKELWQEMNGKPPKITSKPLMIRRLAHQLQMQALPKPWKDITKHNIDRINKIIEKQEKPKNKRTLNLAPGTVLTRFYDNQEHIVTVSESGEFHYQQRIYSNLSVIAREITGTRWSGPLFFGLRNAKKGKSNV